MTYELVVLSRQLETLADDLHRIGEQKFAVLTEAYRTTVIDKLIERNMR